MRDSTNQKIMSQSVSSIYLLGRSIQDCINLTRNKVHDAYRDETRVTHRERATRTNWRPFTLTAYVADSERMSTEQSNESNSERWNEEENNNKWRGESVIAVALNDLLERCDLHGCGLQRLRTELVTLK